MLSGKVITPDFGDMTSHDQTILKVDCFLKAEVKSA